MSEISRQKRRRVQTGNPVLLDRTGTLPEINIERLAVGFDYSNGAHRFNDTFVKGIQCFPGSGTKIVLDPTNTDDTTCSTVSIDTDNHTVIQTNEQKRFIVRSKKANGVSKNVLATTLTDGLAVDGELSCSSINSSGPLSATSVTASGSVTSNSLTTGAVSCGAITSTGVITGDTVNSTNSMRAYLPASVSTFTTVANSTEFATLMTTLPATIVPPNYQVRLSPGVYNISSVSFMALRLIAYVGDTRFGATQRPSVRGATSTWTVTTGSGNTTITFGGSYIPAWTAFGTGDTCWVVDTTGNAPSSYPVVSTTSNSVTFTGTPTLTADGCAIWMQPNVVFELGNNITHGQVDVTFQGIYFRSTTSTIRVITANSRMQFQRCYLRSIKISNAANSDMNLLAGCSWDCVAASPPNECVEANSALFVQQHTFVGSSANACVGIRATSRSPLGFELPSVFINLRVGLQMYSGTARGNGTLWFGRTTAPITGSVGIQMYGATGFFNQSTFVNNDTGIYLERSCYTTQGTDTFTTNNVNIYDFDRAFCNLFSTASASVSLTASTYREMDMAGLTYSTLGRTINNATNAHRIDLIPGTWLVQYTLCLDTSESVTYTTALMTNGTTPVASSTTSNRCTSSNIRSMSCSAVIVTSVNSQVSLALQASSNDTPTIQSVRVNATKLL
jgi:hypothetical protein